MSKFLNFLKAHRKEVLFTLVLIAVVIVFGVAQKHSTRPTGNEVGARPTSDVSAVPDVSPTPGAIKIATDISVYVNGDKEQDVEVMLNNLLTRDGIYAASDSWNVRPLADYAQIDPKYANLSAFATQTVYAKPVDVQVGETTIHHSTGDPVQCLAYAEKKDDGTYTIHRFIVEGRYLVEDYWMPAGADSL